MCGRVGGWVGGGGGGGEYGWVGGGGGVWVRVTLGHLAGPMICKSHEL